jgi:hypothetical protein
MQLDPIAPEETLEEAEAAEPITFDVVGHRRDQKGKVKEEHHEFTCTPDPPFGEFMDFIVEAGTPGSIRRAYEYILASLIDDDERARFDEVLHSPGLRLNPRLVDLLAAALIEAYADRPTSPRSDSQGTPARGSRRSPAAAGSPGSATSRNGRSA